MWVILAAAVNCSCSEDIYGCKLNCVFSLFGQDLCPMMADAFPIIIRARAADLGNADRLV